MTHIKTRNFFLFICFVLPLVMSILAFSSGKGVSQVSNSDVSSKGFGIMGDSISDEYQADDHRGGEYASTTLNWVEQLVKTRHLNFGVWGTWGEPRRTGYEYNWARSGATAETLISSGQHTGLAKQVAEGKVSYVFVWIGSNDFHFTNGTYKEVYDGSLSDEALDGKVNAIVADITLAVDTVLGAGPVDMVMVTIPDVGQIPTIQNLFPAAAGRQRVTDAINSINRKLDSMAAKRNIKLVDANNFGLYLLKQIDKNGQFHIGNALINTLSTGNEPHNWRLPDSAGHAGTVLSGFLANSFFVEPFNTQFDTNIQPLTDAEILDNAGITHNSSGSMARGNGAVPVLFGVGTILILLIAGIFIQSRRH